MLGLVSRTMVAFIVAAAAFGCGGDDDDKKVPALSAEQADQLLDRAALSAEDVPSHLRLRAREADSNETVADQQTMLPKSEYLDLAKRTGAIRQFVAFFETREPRPSGLVFLQQELLVFETDRGASEFNRFLVQDKEAEFKRSFNEGFSSEPFSNPRETSQVKAPALGDESGAYRILVDITGPEGTSPMIVQHTWSREGRILQAVTTVGLESEYGSVVQPLLLKAQQKVDAAASRP